ncbi:MAG: nucleotidyl transferase AbiEii/AbiGii toxin family protein [Parcubacteria group bacterium]|nr:nucleotidyl transferase AbiEii/AbiGii toxin family protein [Parcubacteria group bacterium]
MHKEILTEEQTELFPLLKVVSGDFGLVGGTAIALHLGHRRSIDFDLFSYKQFDNRNIARKVKSFTPVSRILVDKPGEYTFLSKEVKVTFYNYPYKIQYQNSLDKIIKIPDLLTLAAMKAFSLGRRAKWKDYVDLYFIIKDHITIKDIVIKTEDIFRNEFNEKLFRVQLSYFKDINYTEQVDYLPGSAVDDEIIKKGLADFSIAA